MGSENSSQNSGNDSKSKSKSSVDILSNDRDKKTSTVVNEKTKDNPDEKKRINDIDERKENDYIDERKSSDEKMSDNNIDIKSQSTSMDKMKLTSDEILKVLEKHCDKYANNNNYVFKSCNNADSKREWLVVMEKLKNTQTNEGRKNIFDKNYAKFRADILRVVDIINMNIPTYTKKCITNVYEESYVSSIGIRRYIEKSIEYRVGNTVECDYFDTDLNNVCGGGIHYFKSLIAAYYYEKYHSTYTGKIIKWYHNGRKQSEEYFVNGFADGNRLTWYQNGNRKSECGYNNGKKHGTFSTWYMNGQHKNEFCYNEGNAVNAWTIWNENGEILYHGGDAEHDEKPKFIVPKQKINQYGWDAFFL